MSYINIYQYVKVAKCHRNVSLQILCVLIKSDERLLIILQIHFLM